MSVDLNTIWKVLQDVNKKCDNLLKFRDVHLESHKAINEKITDCRNTLYANPDGLTYKVKELIQCKNNFKTSRDYWRLFMFGLLRILAASAIIGLVAWLLSIYKQ